MITCEVCQKEFKSKFGLQAHAIVHDELKQQQKINKWQAKLKDNNREYHIKKTGEYNKSPINCLYCKQLIPYEQAWNNHFKIRFCNNKCSAHFYNPKTVKPVKEKINRRQLFICPCGKQLDLPKSRAAKRKFCSGSCRNKVTNQNIKGSRSKAEQQLEEQLKLNFPTWDIIFNDRAILNGLELDVYIPHLKLAIEWNGVFHFKNIHGDDALNRTFIKDQQKQDECKRLGISLLVICDRTSHKRFIKETITSLVEKLKQI
jgi:hypothetical protein